MAQHYERPTKSFSNLPDDPAIAIWTKLQVPQGENFDSGHWDGLFQPLVHAIGHQETVWAKAEDSPEIVFLVTIWYTTSEQREFETFPSAQLYREGLQYKGIQLLSSHETIYGWSNWHLERTFVQLFWVYFAAPMDDARRAEITELRAIRPPVMGFSVPHHELRQTRPASKQWATRLEMVNGQEVQLLLWPHFWRSREKAEWRIRSNMQKKFIEKLEALGPVQWKEEFYEFKKINKFV
ncbi:hypothetical protein BDW75DRAFT_21927 [Aspergillus navahoensis]